MGESEATNQADVVLLSFLTSGDETTSSARLSQFISEQTEFTVKGIIKSKLHVSLLVNDCSHANQEALDLLGAVQTILLETFLDLRRRPDSKPISNVRSYVAAITFNACHQFLRRKYPQWFQLKNKLRYILTHDSEFSLWEADDHEWLCGFAKWRGDRRPSRTLPEFWQVHDDGTTFGNERSILVGLLTTIFKRAAGPLLLDEIVTWIAHVRGIKDSVTHGEIGSTLDALQGRAGDSASTVLNGIEQRARLQKLWTEIRRLPIRHRAALLLNLRDKRGGDTLALLPVLQIASLCDIAEVLDFTPERFADVWNELPWDDNQVAEHLGLTRQQVINLRQSARARLARCLEGV